MSSLRFRAWHPLKNRMYDVRSLHNLRSGVNVHADLCRNEDEEEKAIFSSHYPNREIRVVDDDIDISGRGKRKLQTWENGVRVREIKGL